MLYMFYEVYESHFSLTILSINIFISNFENTLRRQMVIQLMLDV